MPELAESPALKLILPESTRAASIVRLMRKSRAPDARIDESASTYFQGEGEMSMRLSRLVMSLLVVATVVLMSGRCWAVFNMLPPSNDEWGLKYDLEVTAVEGDKLNVRFTLADAGRLKPIYSATVVAFSRPDPMGGQSYLVKSRIKLQPTKDGKAAGEVQIPREFFNIAMVRILTLTVDRRHQTDGAAYYDIPIRKFLDRKALAATSPKAAPALAAPSVASPPTSRVTK